MALSNQSKHSGLDCCSWHDTGLFIKIFLFGFATIFSLMVICSLLLPNYQPFNNASIVVVIFSIILILLFLRYSFTLQFKFKKYQILLIFIFVFILQLVVALALQVNPIAATWDPQLIFKAAINLSKGENVYIGVYDYFARHPNNLGLVAILLPWFKIWTWLNMTYETLSLILNVVFLNTSLWMLYLSARRMFGEIGSKIALIFGVIFITLSPWVTTFYSDTVGMVFPITILYLYLRFLDSKTIKCKWFIVIIASFLFGIGMVIKPTVIIIAVAIVVAVILKNVEYHKCNVVLKTALYLLVSIFMASISFFGIRDFMVRIMNININSIPESHFIVTGLKKSCRDNNPDYCSYGSYNSEDDIKSYTFMSMDEYRSYTYRTIKERIVSYGFVGYIDYLIKKGAWTIGDGTFFAYGEGSSAIAPVDSDFFGSSFIKDALHKKGDYYPITILIVQSMWFSMLFLLLLTIYRRRRTSHVMLIIYLSLFGILLFNLVFEARSRYIYLYVPIFIIGAVFAINENMQYPICHNCRK